MNELCSSRVTGPRARKDKRDEVGERKHDEGGRGDARPHSLYREGDCGSRKPHPDPELRLRAYSRESAIDHPCTSVAFIFFNESHAPWYPGASLLATLLIDSGDFVEAESLCRTALPLQEKVVGDNHPRVARTLNVLSRVLIKTKHYDEAEALFINVLLVRRQWLGEGHPHTLVSANNLVDLYSEMGRYEEAALAEAHRILAESLGERHDRTKATMTARIELYDAWAKPEKAAEWRTSLLKSTENA